jgi:hypothetical protein
VNHTITKHSLHSDVYLISGNCPETTNTNNTQHKNVTPGMQRNASRQETMRERNSSLATNCTTVSKQEGGNMNRTNTITPVTAAGYSALPLGRIALTSIMIAALALLAACAGEPPKETMSQAELAVTQVASTNAAQLQPLEVRKARDHLDQAKMAQSDKDYKEARRLAEKAIVEAKLAEAKTDAQVTQNMLAELQQSIKAMREETTQ